MKEVCVIGGGIIGLFCAYFLYKSGKQVTIIDKGDFSEGCSYGNAGMIVPSHFIPLATPSTIEKGMKWMFKRNSPLSIKPRLDMDLWRWLWMFEQSADRDHIATAAPLLRDLLVESRDYYTQLSRSSSFTIDFESKGILMLYQTLETEHEEEETADMAYTLGIEARKLSHSQVQRMEPDIKTDVRGGFYYPGDAHLNPEKLMIQMIEYLKSSGVEFISGKEVIALDDSDKTKCVLSLNTGEHIPAKNIVVACGSWSGKLLKKNKYHLPIQDGKGYSMTFTQLSKKPVTPSILIESRVAITPLGKDLRISGTFEMSGMDDRINRHKVKAILDAVPGYYPDLALQEQPKVWFGYRPCSPDGLPYIGRWKQGSPIIIATGHAMMGLSLAPVTGRLVSDLVHHKTLPTTIGKLSPNRFS